MKRLDLWKCNLLLENDNLWRPENYVHRFVGYVTGQCINATFKDTYFLSHDLFIT